MDHVWDGGAGAGGELEVNTESIYTTDLSTSMFEKTVLLLWHLIAYFIVPSFVRLSAIHMCRELLDGRPYKTLTMKPPELRFHLI